MRRSPAQHQPPPPAKGRSPQLRPCTGKVASAGAGPLRRATRPAAGHDRAPPPPTPSPPPQPHTTRPPPTTTRPEERRTSCRRDAAKMSPRISIGPEPVLAAHAPFQPSAGSHCPAREGSALGNRVFQPLVECCLRRGGPGGGSLRIGEWWAGRHCVFPQYGVGHAWTLGLVRCPVALSGLLLRWPSGALGSCCVNTVGLRKRS